MDNVVQALLAEVNQRLEVINDHLIVESENDQLLSPLLTISFFETIYSLIGDTVTLIQAARVVSRPNNLNVDKYNKRVESLHIALHTLWDTYIERTEPRLDALTTPHET